ncbi:hypothetical protein MmiHf6_17110 [Methanimicrococcus hongohii]|uniref:Uncharacterized protein n=1 Tax=Methanimicrococcus hongohii TaxID=3028295 RepID=A0AA96ZTB8_9EURY|nr:hypothetical protein [Methanimicrococcus sp. Hf6]WNY24380.1 hypothetical protein MmiHf6_17110 [Methanimicrococcus sp. Hf6]
MWYESFSEIFRYVGQAPEPTPEEAAEIEKTIKEMNEDLECQIKRIRTGIRLDGTKYDDEELIIFKSIFGEEGEIKRIEK